MCILQTIAALTEYRLRSKENRLSELFTDRVELQWSREKINIGERMRFIYRGDRFQFHKTLLTSLMISAPTEWDALSSTRSLSHSSHNVLLYITLIWSLEECCASRQAIQHFEL